MIRLLFVEMDLSLVSVGAAAARQIADIKEMRSTMRRLEDMQSSWTEKAELALSKGREDLAKAALVERQKAADIADGIAEDLAELEQVLRAYEVDINRLQSKLSEARSRQNAISARMQSAITRAKASEVMHGSRTQEALASFEVLERHADFAEGRADALGMGAHSLEDQIAELKAAEKVDAELEAMKAALAARNQ